MGGKCGVSIFTYSPKYLESGDAAPISISLPLTAETFSPDATGSFLRHHSGGQLNRDLEKRARVERGDYFKVLDLVRDEPVGALVLTREPSGDSLEMDYEEIGAEQLSGLAYAPAEVAFDLALESRIPLQVLRRRSVSTIRAMTHVVDGTCLMERLHPRTFSRRGRKRSRARQCAKRCA
ncbi:MAG: HipA N-terminal domain-containing protein [Collinsella sp.]